MKEERYEKEYKWFVKILLAKQKGFRPTTKKEFERICCVDANKHFNLFWKNLIEEKLIEKDGDKIIIDTKLMWKKMINNPVGSETDKLFFIFHIGFLT